jgi:cellulose synthase/poly-beta-1,6-N-acetylglucosamine synthase-like glycosyltransferase
MNLLNIIFLALSFLIIFFLILPFLTVWMSTIFRVEKTSSTPSNSSISFGCIITAYKNAEIAGPLIRSLLMQTYPNFHIYFVADECDMSNWKEIENTAVKGLSHEGKLSVLHPDPPLRLKAKSIILGMENFVLPHDFTVIFDADNLAHPDFLKTIHGYINQGYLAIQGQRTAKNLDTRYAATDALGEFYKNYIERYAPYLIGSSSVISGSGMAVETKLYASYLESPEIEEGKHKWKKMLQEDKILQNFLLKKNHKIAYAWKALVYDEKVTTGQGIETQRSRWLFSYFQNIPNSLGILRRGILGFNWNQFYFGLITIAPPMFIQLMLAFIIFILGLIINPWISFLVVIAGLLFVMTILWTLKLSKAPKPVWDAVYATPSFVVKQIKGLLKMGNPNKNFQHTQHTVKVNIDDILKDPNIEK